MGLFVQLALSHPARGRWFRGRSGHRGKKGEEQKVSTLESWSLACGDATDQHGGHDMAV